MALYIYICTWYIQYKINPLSYDMVHPFMAKHMLYSHGASLGALPARVPRSCCLQKKKRSWGFEELGGGSSRRDETLIQLDGFRSLISPRSFIALFQQKTKTKRILPFGSFITWAAKRMQFGSSSCDERLRWQVGACERSAQWAVA